MNLLYTIVAAFAAKALAATTSCTTVSYDTSPAKASLSYFGSIVMAAGSTVEAELAKNIHFPGVPQAKLAIYQTDYTLFHDWLLLQTSLSNSDADIIVSIGKQLQDILDALSTTSSSVVDAVTFAALVNVLNVETSLESIFLQRRISTLSCDRINSLSSINSALYSQFSKIALESWVGSLLHFTNPYSTIPGCTSTIAAGTYCQTIADTTTSSTSTTSTTSTSSTSSTTSTSTTSSAAATSTTSTSTSAASSTTSASSTSTTAAGTSSTSTDTNVYSTETYSGSVRRCRVRPTSV